MTKPQDLRDLTNFKNYMFFVAFFMWLIFESPLRWADILFAIMFLYFFYVSYLLDQRMIKSLEEKEEA